MSIARVLWAEAEAVGAARRDGDDILDGAATLHAWDVRAGVRAHVRGVEPLHDVGADTLVLRRDDDADGQPAASSFANDGPEGTQVMVRLAGELRGEDLVHERERAVLDALRGAHDGAECGTLRATSCATSRVACDGATKTTIDAPESASSGSTVAVSVVGSLALGRYLPLTWSPLICATRSGRRQYIWTGSPLSARTLASAVPHAPAPAPRLSDRPACSSCGRESSNVVLACVGFA